MKSSDSVTIKDIAKKAGISYSSVSRALAGAKGVSKEKRAKIMRVADECGYRPNMLARGLVKRQTKTIGLVLPDLTNPFFSELAQIIFDEARSHGYNIILDVTGRDFEQEKNCLSLLLSSQVDGVILKSYKPHFGVESASVPVIMLEKADSPNFSYVDVSDESGGAKAANYLLDRGYRHPVILGGKTTSVSHRLRIEGFQRAWAQAGYPGSDITVEFGDFTLESGQEGTAGLLRRKLRFDCIFCANDIVALGALQALGEKDLRVPEDVGVFGFDDITYARLPQIQLTTIRQPLQEMGELAVSMLIRQIEKGVPASPVRVSLDPELVVRKTCK
ncbi:MAG: LacI family transcriptional regulator [Lachnospiraceae bacterium]|jgi:LacI family transcriptional regulator|nr:LacI family transcriptional regulator [Lachnospiraceae bacterium]